MAKGAIQFTLELPRNFFEELERILLEPMAGAMTRTFLRGADILGQRAQENIASSGGPDTALWQKLVSIKVFPEGRISPQPAIFLNVKPRYSNIFEEGGDIKSLFRLWLPLPTVPKEQKNQGEPKALTPRELSQSGVKLVSLGKSKKGNPIMGTNIRTNMTPPFSEFTTSQLAQGTDGEGGKVQGVPLYFAKRTVTIPPKFDIRFIADRVRGDMIKIFSEELSKDLRN